VCSTTAARIARICAAIEDLAGRPEEGADVSVPTTAAAERLAAIWAMIAEVDPGVAKRLPGYLAADE
jgi:hypothetical protein